MYLEAKIASFNLLLERCAITEHSTFLLIYFKIIVLYKDNELVSNIHLLVRTMIMYLVAGVCIHTTNNIRIHLSLYMYETKVVHEFILFDLVELFVDYL